MRQLQAAHMAGCRHSCPCAAQNPWPPILLAPTPCPSPLCTCTPGDKAYAEAMAAALRAEGKPIPMSSLGSKVKRPEGVSMKLKAFVLAHPQLFKFDEQTQAVSLAK